MTDEPRSVFVVSEHQKNLLLMLQFIEISPNYNFKTWNYSLKVFRTNDWKYISVSNRKDELYSLKKDPAE